MKKLLTFILCATFSLGMNAADFFVDGAIAASGDGLTWETAKKTIPEALTLAKTNNTTSQDDNIYVKAGTYMGATAATVPLDLTHVDCTGISLFGGFASASTGIDITQRDIVVNTTIIDAQNGANAVKIAQKVTLDGFIIQNGTESSYTQNAVSAGVAISHASAVVVNCIIKNNIRTTGNNKSSAGGVFIKAGTIRSCEIFNNSTTHSNSQGGAIQITGGTIERCKIYNNTSGATGQVGGILVAKVTSTMNAYALLDNNITLANNLIYNNNFQGIKVGLITGETKTVSLINNTIVNNGSATILDGAGIAQLTATNNIFYNNAVNETFTIQTTYTYNAIQAPTVTGTGNIALASGNQANLFTSPTTTPGKIADASSNWLPISGSGLVNVGDNAAAAGSIDIAGNTRIQQTTIDLGAYETSLSTTLTKSTKNNISTVYSRQGGVVIENADAYQIFSIEGRLLQSGLVQSNFIPLNKGAYIVKTFVGNKSEITKVIVK